MNPEGNNQPPQPIAPQAYVPEEEAKSPVKRILSFVIGFAVVAVLLIVMAVFIIPRIFSGGDKNVTLTYWLTFEDPEPFKAAAAEFHQKNPNITVNVEKQDIKSLGNYMERFKTRSANGNGPDIVRYHNSWVPEIVGNLLPLPRDVVSATQIDSKYYPVIDNDLKVNGAYYGVPIDFDTLALFVNTDLFQAAGITSYPTTWDDVIVDARKLTVKDQDGKIQKSGIALGTYENIAHAPDIISLLLVQNGADLKNLGGPTKESASDALQFYTSFATGNDSVWNTSMPNSTLAFAQGNLAMYVGYSWDSFVINAMNPDLKYKIVPIPHLPGRDNSIASYWVEGVSSSSKHPKESFEFLKFLASKQTMENLYSQQSKTRAFGEPYPRADMADLLKSNDKVYPFVQQGPKAASTYFAADTYDGAMVDQLNSYLKDAINSIINNGSSADTAVDTLAAGASQVFSKYVGAAKSK